MNGVLAKPFTKEGMLKSVKTHMAHLLKNPPAPGSPDFILGGIPFLNPGAPMAGAPNSIKLEPPGASAHGGPAWSNDVDHGFGIVNGGGPYGMAPAGRSAFGTPLDNESPPEKRQRLNPGYSG